MGKEKDQEKPDLMEALLDSFMLHRAKREGEGRQPKGPQEEGDVHVDETAE